MAVHGAEKDEDKEIPPQVLEKITSCLHQRSSRIDLSRRNMKNLPESFFDLSHVQYVYLSDNKLQQLPEVFTSSFMQIVWLDLRSNQLIELPQNIALLKNLKNLLLDDNKIEVLPLQLGLLHQLSGLNLSNNPLSYPPKKIIEAGTKRILSYLREQLAIEQRFGNLELDDAVEKGVSKESYTNDFAENENVIDSLISSDDSTNTVTDSNALLQNNISLLNIKKSVMKLPPRKVLSQHKMKSSITRTATKNHSKFNNKDNTIQQDVVNTTQKESSRNMLFDMETLKENDMVLLKVPTEQFILNQPRIGKVVRLEDELGFILVHYYTGSFSGYWWPMMSRESRYLHEEKSSNVLMKFNLLEDGKMDNNVIRSIKKLNNGFSLNN